MGVFVGGDNCGELNGWFCVFCNCLVCMIVVFVVFISCPFFVLRSLLASLPILTMSARNHNDCNAHSQSLSLHSQQHSPTHPQRTNYSPPKNKKQHTQLKRTQLKRKRTHNESKEAVSPRERFIRDIFLPASANSSLKSLLLNYYVRTSQFGRKVERRNMGALHNPHPTGRRQESL